MKYTLVLLRHGQTVHNKEKMFCGWTDSDLTEKGIAEATSAGKNLKAAGYSFDIGFSSVLKRAMETLSIALDEMGLEIPIAYTWRLNERHYGALQGEKHEEIARKHSPEQVHIWRRSYAERPPLLLETDPRHPCNDPKYCDMDVKDLPCGESLADTVARVMPYWENEIVPHIQAGKKVVIAASGNSLRALIKKLDGISDDDIVGLELKNGVPLVYELDETFKPLRKFYLVDGGKEEPIMLKASA